MSNIKDLHCKPRLGIATLLHKIVFYCRVYAPAIHASNHVDHEKRVAWFIISCVGGFVDISYGALLGRPLGGWSSAII